ncbi:MAG: hypothetical protein R2730_13090 [Chitinophagales bacterium]
MTTVVLPNDIHLLCVIAKTFPDGVKQAFDQLYQQVPNAQERTCYGIYEEQEGKITYRAALAAQTLDEAQNLNMESYVVVKGSYARETIQDWPANIPTIGATFCKMLENEKIDKESPSIEAYQPNDVLHCLLRLKN